MNVTKLTGSKRFALIFCALIFGASCGAPGTNSNITVSTNVGANSNSISNSNLNSSAVPASAVETREPDQYQALVKLTIETLGGGPQKGSIPAIGAMVARSGNDRMMQLQMPTNEKVIFLDKGGINYLILPSRKQYAELTKESIGFDVRRMLMPEQIVNQAKAMQGVKFVGDEKLNGRDVLKYAYQATANTQTTAGDVNTESYMLIDKETGLPLRTETVSQTQNGANVQGMNGLRVVTEMTDIQTTPDASAFVLPTDFQKIDAETVKNQVNLIFQVVGSFIGQAINGSQPRSQGSPAATVSPTATPVR